MPAVNPGRTNLVAYWSLDETSGNRADSHGGNTLTDVNTVGSASGKVGDAADFEAGNSEYLSAADNAALSTGDIDFTLCAWVNMESKPAYAARIMSKRSASTACDYDLYWENVADRFVMEIRNGAGTSKSVVASNFGAPSLATWYFVAAYHDAAGDIIGISVNAGAANTAATAGVAPTDSASQFRMGDLQQTGGRWWDGMMDEACIYKRVLTADEITWLYNGGAGRAYSALAGGAPTMMQHHHAMLANRR